MSDNNNPTIWMFEGPISPGIPDVKVKIVTPDERCITHVIKPTPNDEDIIKSTWKSRSAMLEVRNRDLFDADDQESRSALIAYVGGFRAKKPCLQCRVDPLRFEECRLNMVWPAISGCTCCGTTQRCSLRDGPNADEKREEENSSYYCESPPWAPQFPGMHELPREAFSSALQYDLMFRDVFNKLEARMPEFKQRYWFNDMSRYMSKLEELGAIAATLKETRKRIADFVAQEPEQRNDA